MCTLGVLGLPCETPAAPKAAGVSHEKPPKTREDPQEGKKKAKLERERENKSANFCASLFGPIRAPPLRAPTLRGPHWGEAWRGGVWWIGVGGWVDGTKIGQDRNWSKEENKLAKRGR